MVGTQQFNLRWNNHTSNILQVFLEHLSSELLVDVTLSCQGQFIRAHKIILSACSPYFQEVFANHTAKHPIIILNGIKYEDLESMIKFMYNGEIRVQEAQLDDLLAAAEMLQVKGLSNVRSKYERGEITSLNPAQKSTPAKVADPVTAAATATTAATAAIFKKELPVHAIKAAVALFAPTATTTRAPNTKTSALGLATPATNTDPCAPTCSYRTVTTVPRVPNTGFRASVNNRSSGNGAPGLAIATIIPVSAPTSMRGSVPPNVPWTVASIVPSSIASTLSTTATTLSTISTPITTIAGSTVSTSTSALAIGPSSTTSGASVHFNDSDDASSISDKTPLAERSSAPTTAKISQSLIANTESHTSTSGTTTASAKDMEKKSPEAETPRVRKRRKMSHTVNELARETVFTSNGTVLLEPDEAVVKSMAKIKKTFVDTRTDNSDSGEIDDTNGSNEAKKLKIMIQTKPPQTSLLIKEKNPGKIPRPPNAFMIFANEWRRKLAIEYPEENNTRISVRLGMMWKGLNIQAKDTYYKLAKKADKEHKHKYPGYSYNPKAARLRKTMKQDAIPSKCLQPSLRDSSIQRTVKFYVNGEERETEYYTDTDSSDYEDDDDDENYENYEDEEQPYESDIEVVRYSEDENDPNEKSHDSSKRKDSASSEKPGSSATT